MTLAFKMQRLHARKKKISLKVYIKMMTLLVIISVQVCFRLKQQPLVTQREPLMLVSISPKAGKRAYSLGTINQD